MLIIAICKPSDSQLTLTWARVILERMKLSDGIEFIGALLTSQLLFAYGHGRRCFVNHVKIVSVVCVSFLPMAVRQTYRKDSGSR